MKVLLALLISIFFTGNEFKVKFGSVIPKDSPWEAGVNDYIKYAETQSAGTLKFKTYLGGQLGGEVEMIKSLAMGTLDAGGFTTAALAEALALPQLQVFELPFLFESDAEADYVMDAMFKPMSELLDKKGVMLVMWGTNGWRSFGTRSKPITKPADLKGLKMRSQESDVYINFYKTLGATPVPITTPDVLISLKSGMIDGFDQTPIFSMSTGWTSASKYFTLSNHIYQPGAIVISKRFYNKLPKQAQVAILASTARSNMQKKSFKYVRDEDAQMTASMEEITGIKVTKLTDAQKQEFKKATAQVYSIMEAKIGKSVLQQVRNEIQKFRQLKK